MTRGTTCLCHLAFAFSMKGVYPAISLHQIWDCAMELGPPPKNPPNGKTWIKYFEEKAEEVAKTIELYKDIDRLLIDDPETFVEGMKTFAKEYGYKEVDPKTEELAFTEDYKVMAKEFIQLLTARAGYALAQCFRDICRHL
eukprot:TRINITY_DN8288_c0_g1_i1.p2 TRINITY_DN8288_c0_g1~~TRINITY_DN8288_c0_g1_i1.p2  ORF type:complete len:141 (+),score=10.16 TRINITY_DN8288_c0_g1_i1:690-1112(+)